MKWIDYHIHCNYSSDNQNKIYEIFKKLSESDFYDACIVTHFEPHTFGKSLKRPFNSIVPEKFDSYFKEIERYNQEFNLNVKVGLEVTYEEEIENEIDRFLKEYNFDFSLGAIHYLGGESIFDEPQMIYGGKKPEEVISNYFGKTIKMIKTGFFDSIAHIDILRRGATNYYGTFPLEFYGIQLKKVAEALIKNKVCFELNTNPYRAKPGEKPTYPYAEGLKLLYESGARLVTTGSDAHDSGRIGDRMPEAINLLSKTGFKNISTFDKRKIKLVEIAKLTE
jgi:histidinol-phosphatase (PHP family)